MSEDSDFPAADSPPLRVVLDQANFRALVAGNVAEAKAVTGEPVELMLDISLETMMAVIEAVHKKPLLPESEP
jgi:hypothetical protein